MLVQVKFGSSVNGNKILSARVISTWFHGESVRGDFDQNLSAVSNSAELVQKLVRKLNVKEEGRQMKFNCIATPDGYMYMGQSSASSFTTFSLR